MILAWTLRLLDLESSSPPLSYAASLALALEGIAILVFHALKSEDVSHFQHAFAYMYMNHSHTNLINSF